MVRQSKEIHPDLHKLFHFTAARPSREAGWLPTEDDYGLLVGSRGQPRLFLGYYDQDMIEAKLRQFGITERLETQGFHNITVSIDTRQEDRQRLIICDGELTRANLLAEVALTVGDFMPQTIANPHLCNRVFRMLYIQWLCLQNPRASFTPQRPALPGQRHPGLKVGAIVAHLFERIASRLELDGIISIPEYIHNAILYSRRFRFFNPVVEGRLKALTRDLKDLPLSTVSFGVETGCVIDANTGQALEGMHEEQVFPRHINFRRYFASRHYQESMASTADQVRYVFDAQRYNQEQPLRDDGFPAKPPEDDCCRGLFD